MDDWQSAAFNNRHLHNRVHQRRQSRGGGHGAVFDARNTLGSYEVKCSATKSGGIGFEICQFSEDGDGLVGTIVVPGVVQAYVILAASRKEMNAIVEAVRERSNKPRGPIRWSEKENLKRQAEKAKQAESNDMSGEEEENEEEDDDDDEEDEDEDEDEDENDTRFEKNSFREPKFWMQWQGTRLKRTEDVSEDMLTGSGYVVFTGNDCKKFSGTLSCDDLEWNNVKMTGFKNAWKAERDIDITWK